MALLMTPTTIHTRLSVLMMELQQALVAFHHDFISVPTSSRFFIIFVICISVIIAMIIFTIFNNFLEKFQRTRQHFFIVTEAVMQNCWEMLYILRTCRTVGRWCIYEEHAGSLSTVENKMNITGTYVWWYWELTENVCATLHKERKQITYSHS